VHYLNDIDTDFNQGNHHIGALVELGEHMKQQRHARSAKRQRAKFVEVDDDQKTIRGIVFPRRGGRAWSWFQRPARR